VSNPSKQKGTRFETEVAEYLGVERRTLGGSKDRGDLAIVNWALELKATREIDLASAIDEARVEAKNAKAPYFAAIVKRRRKGVSEAYFVMTLAEARRFLVQPDR
jgi:predicted transcriptional regulator